METISALPMPVWGIFVMSMGGLVVQLLNWWTNQKGTNTKAEDTFRKSILARLEITEAHNQELREEVAHVKGFMIAVRLCPIAECSFRDRKLNKEEE